MKEKLVRGTHAFGLAWRIAVSVIIVALIIWKYKELQNIDVRALVDSSANIFYAVAAILGVYLLKSVTFVVPASIIYIAVGMAFPPLAAVLINLAGIALEVTVSYFVGVILGGKYVTRKLENTKYGPKILSLQSKGKLSAIFGIRFLPVFPIDLVSLSLGAIRMNFLPYILLSLGGIMPRVILFTILGDGIYDFIPMDKLVMAAVILIPAALIAWIISYAVKAKRSEEEAGKPAYEPLMDSHRYVIFDTDMGPDCDDAGALALLYVYAEKYGLKILGAANCTSNSYANGAIRAIASFYGDDDIIVGQHSGDPVLPDGDKYNKAVTKKYETSDKALSETDFYSKLLSKAEDDSVTVITVGTFSNIAKMLEHNEMLFNKKVNSIVSMAGKFPEGKEFNIESDIPAAQTVLDKFKNTIVFSGHEIGNDIETGFAEAVEGSPVFDSYKLYLGGHKLPYRRSSYDLTAVQYAVEGNGDFYALSGPVKITVDDEGNFKAEKDKYAKCRYMKRKASPDVIAAYLEELVFENKAAQ